MVATAAVLGAGAWGTVFAQVLADAGNRVFLWARRPEQVESINRGENPQYVPGVGLNGIEATGDAPAALADSSLVVVAVPSFAVRQVLTEFRDHIRPDATVVSLVKGVEPGSLLFMSDVIADATEVAPDRIVAVSGPNLSAEIARHEPTGTVVAGIDLERAGLVASRIHTDYFRPYVSGDIIGAEIGGVVKNVIAMVVGAAVGLEKGINTRSSLITRGLNEMARLGVALGGEAETFLGLAGLGDLVATCSTPLSRNFAFGQRIGRGMAIEEALAESAGVVEGARSCPLILQIADSRGVDMPITGCAGKVLSGQMSPDEVAAWLLRRPRSTDGVDPRQV